MAPNMPTAKVEASRTRHLFGNSPPIRRRDQNTPIASPKRQLCSAQAPRQMYAKGFRNKPRVPRSRGRGDKFVSYGIRKLRSKRTDGGHLFLLHAHVQVNLPIYARQIAVHEEQKQEFPEARAVYSECIGPRQVLFTSQSEV